MMTPSSPTHLTGSQLGPVAAEATARRGRRHDVLRPVVVAIDPPDDLDTARASLERDWLSID
jgi:hypothetical protein